MTDLEEAIAAVQKLADNAVNPTHIKTLYVMLQDLEQMHPDRLARFTKGLGDKYIADMYAETKKAGWGERFLAKKDRENLR